MNNKKKDKREAWSTKAAAFLGPLVAILTGGFAVYELLPKYGVWAPTLFAVLILFYWWWSGSYLDAKPSWEQFRGILKDFSKWWQLGLATLILIVTWGLAAIDKISTSFGRQDYLYVSDTLGPIQVSTADEKYPKSPGTNVRNRRESQQYSFSAWQNWMANGAQGGVLFCVESPQFEADYADLTATLTIDSSHTIHKCVALLEYDEPSFANDPNYRPRWRQMRTRVLQGNYSVDVLVEAPDRGEKLLLFIQILPPKGESSIDLDRCFIFDHLEVS